MIAACRHAYAEFQQLAGRTDDALYSALGQIHALRYQNRERRRPPRSIMHLTEQGWRKRRKSLRGTRTIPWYSPRPTLNSTACLSEFQRASSGKLKNMAEPSGNVPILFQSKMALPGYDVEPRISVSGREVGAEECVAASSRKRRLARSGCCSRRSIRSQTPPRRTMARRLTTCLSSISIETAAVRSICCAGG